MNSKLLNSLKTIVLILISSVLTNQFASLPWWSFLIPILLIGMFIKSRDWQMPTFFTGFLAGFILWFAANYYFEATSNGLVLDKVGALLSVPKIVVLIISGVLGGLCSALALYTGKLMFSKKEEPTLV